MMTTVIESPWKIETLAKQITESIRDFYVDSGKGDMTFGVTKFGDADGEYDDASYNTTILFPVYMTVDGWGFEIAGNYKTKRFWNNSTKKKIAKIIAGRLQSNGGVYTCPRTNKKYRIEYEVPETIGVQDILDGASNFEEV